MQIKKTAFIKLPEETITFGKSLIDNDDHKIRLLGTFILSKLGSIIDKKNTGLYHDDVLVVLRNMNVQKKIKSERCENLVNEQVFNTIKPEY